VRRLLALALGVLWLVSGASASTLADFPFDSPEKEQEFRELTEQLRCLVCQNESLAGSQAELAQDLRREVYEMMISGKTRDEIINFLVARYGDFVLYSPPLKPTTYVLWFGPVLLALLGAFVLWRTLRRKSLPQETALSEDEQRRLKEILASEQTPGKS